MFFGMTVPISLNHRFFLAAEIESPNSSIQVERGITKLGRKRAWKMGMYIQRMEESWGGKSE